MENNFLKKQCTNNHNTKVKFSGWYTWHKLLILCCAYNTESKMHRIYWFKNAGKQY